MPGLFGKFSLFDVLVYIGIVAVAIIATRLLAPRYYDRVIAAASLSGLLVFLAIVGLKVQSTSLRIVLLISSAMAIYDFWLDAYSKKSNGDET